MWALSSYDYDLPLELIAQYPSVPRDRCRLLVVDRKTGQMQERVFFEIEDLLKSGDSIVFNDTKVYPARLKGRKTTGAEVEVLLTKQLSPHLWEALAKPGRRLTPGHQVLFGEDFSCTIVKTQPDGSKVVKLHFEGDDPYHYLQRYGKIPLPTYMKRDATVEDNTDYQTVYAQVQGSVAAPTAGLHFTQELLDRLEAKGVKKNTITLHVGIGTFRQPLTVEDIRDHKMHQETLHIAQEEAKNLNQKCGQRILVGTTTCRALETACVNGKIVAGDYETDIFIYPGYTFKYTKALLTNFHLPRSSLLMLVAAFAGYELTLEAYRKAVRERFRFYSYGDAMLIL